jgi:hypothetical protein
MTVHLERVETSECLVVTSARREYILVMYERYPHSVKRVCATWGISGDVCICILCFSAGTLTTFA